MNIFEQFLIRIITIKIIIYISLHIPFFGFYCKNIKNTPKNKCKIILALNYF